MKRLVVWGGTEGLESHRWIHKHFFLNANKLGYKAAWVSKEPFVNNPGFSLEEGDLVICADIYGEHLPFKSGVDYVLHNFDGNGKLCQQIPPENIVRLQVYTKQATGEKWDDCRYFDREARTLFQPWGTHLLAEEFQEPVYNPMSRTVTFVGAVWSERGPTGEMGNQETINELQSYCRVNGLELRLLTHIPDTTNLVECRMARLAPSFVGAWQADHGYVPCRALKNSSFGVAMVTNSETVWEMFGNLPITDVPEAMDAAMRLKKSSYQALVRDQQRVASRYTYRESIASILRALEEGR